LIHVKTAISGASILLHEEPDKGGNVPVICKNGTPVHFSAQGFPIKDARARPGRTRDGFDNPFSLGYKAPGSVTAKTGFLP
jgi:hypothetical protein